MAGFGGSTGVSKGYVDKAISQSTALVNQTYTFTNVAAGAGQLAAIQISNPPSGKTLRMVTVYQTSRLNLVPVWVAGIDGNLVRIQTYNARTSATDIDVTIAALYF